MCGAVGAFGQWQIDTTQNGIAAHFIAQTYSREFTFPDWLTIGLLLLVLPCTLATSCAFMMPVSTPPNAIIFGTRRISIARMCKTGLWLNLLAIAVISVLAVLLH